MSAGAIIDNGLRLYRNNLLPMLFFSLVIGGLLSLGIELIAAFSSPDPINALSYGDLWGIIARSATIDSASYDANMNAINSMYGMETNRMLLSAALAVFVTPFVQGGVTNIAASAAHGYRSSPADWLKRTGRYYGKLALTGLIAALTAIVVAVVIIIVFSIMLTAILFSVSMGVLLSNPGVADVWGLIILIFVLLAVFGFAAFIALGWLGLIYPVAACEGVFHFRALGRAFTLFFRGMFKSARAYVAAFLMVYLLEFVLDALFMQLVLMFGLPWLIYTVFTVVLSSLLEPIMLCSLLMLYLDIRVRRDGYDLLLLARGLA